MDKKRIVVALGRNAFGETFPEQQANVKKAAKAIADLVEAKYQIVITHSNGPHPIWAMMIGISGANFKIFRIPDG